MAELTNEQIIEHIKHMSVLDLNNLVKTIEQEFGVSAAAATVAVGAPAAGGAAPAEAAEEKTEFTVVLTAYGDKKVQVIKAVRELTSLGLKEAKDLVDGVPGVVKEGLNKEEAAAAKAKLEEAGAQVEIK